MKSGVRTMSTAQWERAMVKSLHGPPMGHNLSTFPTAPIHTQVKHRKVKQSTLYVVLRILYCLRSTPYAVLHTPEYLQSISMKVQIARHTISALPGHSDPDRSAFTVEIATQTAP